MLLLDRKQLDINRFLPSLDGHSVNMNIKNIVQLFKLQAKLQQVRVKFEKLPEDVVQMYDDETASPEKVLYFGDRLVSEQADDGRS